jgi:hypothetical protein
MEGLTCLLVRSGSRQSKCSTARVKRLGLRDTTLRLHRRVGCRGVSNSSRTELFANFSEKARVRQVRTFFLNPRTVRGVCLPIIPLHNKQYNMYIFLENDFFFFDLVRSAYFSSKFRELLPELFPNFFPNCSVRFGSVRKCISSSSVRFENFKKCTPLTWLETEFSSSTSMTPPYLRHGQVIHLKSCTRKLPIIVVYIFFILKKITESMPFKNPVTQYVYSSVLCDTLRSLYASFLRVRVRKSVRPFRGVFLLLLLR